MPRVADVTPEQVEYLRQAVERGVSYPEMARNIGVCTDTCKRYLHKHGIVEFTAAKYIVARPLHPPVATWQRPCMTCGCTESRPRGQYRCDTCHEREEYL